MTEHTHSCTSFSSVYYKLSSEYRQKRRLRVQNRPGGCVLRCTDSSRQQEVPLLCIRKQSTIQTVKFYFATSLSLGLTNLSDKLVYITASIRLIGSCHPTLALAGPIFSHLWNPHPTIPGGLYDIFGRFCTGVGRPIGVPGPVQASYRLFGAQSGNFGL